MVKRLRLFREGAERVKLLFWTLLDPFVPLSETTELNLVHCEELHLLTLLINTNFLCNSVAIYLCFTSLLIRTITPLKQVIQR